MDKQIGKTVSDIPLKRIIRIDDPTTFKFHAARWDKTDQPLDVYVRDKKEWFDWNTYRFKRNDFSRDYIFSLIDFYHETDMWLFGGIFEVKKRSDIPNSHSYKIKELTEYSCYVGRLKVKLEKLTRGRAFLLERFLDKMKVAEILKKPFSGAVFPGYENINHDFDILAPIFENENPDWKSALKNVQGVYVIMDKETGWKYVGSAYGDSGIWKRWTEYLETGHGWNKELMDLISSHGREYAMKNFTLSLLEFRSMKVDDKIIIARESYWKEVFLSREYGYNEN